MGTRRGPAVILVVRSALMHAEEHVFYRSENGIRLVDEVPSGFLVFPQIELENPTLTPLTPDQSSRA